MASKSAPGAVRQLTATIKLVISAGAAKPSPPVGPALGQAGLNIMAFCKEFNAKTSGYKVPSPLAHCLLCPLPVVPTGCCNACLGAGCGGQKHRVEGTHDHMQEGVPLRVSVRVFSDKSYEWDLKTPPTSWLVKQACGLARAADKPGHEEAATISLKHIYEIARVKQRDTPTTDVQAMCKSIMSSCKSMGVGVVARPEDAAQ